MNKGYRKHTEGHKKFRTAGINTEEKEFTFVDKAVNKKFKFTQRAVSGTRLITQPFDYKHITQVF